MIIFIPIKHKSQRVPNKNFRMFGDEPLYKHTLLKLKNHSVFVDTDSETLIEQINKDTRLKHVHVYQREQLLKGHHISVCDLIKNFIVKKKINQAIAQIHVTSPFLKVETLENAFLYTTKYDSVVSCNTYNSRFWRKEQYGFCPVNHNPLKMEQTQDLPKLYEENSSFYIFQPEVIISTGNRVGANPLFYPLSSPESLDIDTEEDWDCAIGQLK
jgi:CMP-N-acetylneuraminic acid synthetase